MDSKRSWLACDLGTRSVGHKETDATSQLDRPSSCFFGSVSKGTKRTWAYVNGIESHEHQLCALGLCQSPSSSDIGDKFVLRAASTDEESSVDLDLNVKLNLWRENTVCPNEMSSIAPKSPCNENKFDLQLGLSTGSSESAMTSAKGKQHSRLETSQLVCPVLVDEEEVSASSCLIFGSYLAHGAQNSDFNCSISCNQKIHPKISVEVEPSYDFPAAMIQRTKSPVASTSGISHSQNRSNSTKKCQFQGCEKGARGASGLCIAHGGGRRCQKSSCQKGAEGRTIYCKTHGGGRRCEFLGCTKSSEGRTDFCIAHGGGRRCNHEGCNRAARGKSGLCIRHGGGKRCQMENCTKSAEGYSGLCISHGGGRRCRFPACTKGAQGSTFFCKAHGGGKRCTFLGCTKGAEGSTPFCKGHGGGKRCSFQGGDVCPKSARWDTILCCPWLRETVCCSRMHMEC